MLLPPVILFFLGLSTASPVELVEERQSSCPNIHVFGARETTAPAGYGTAGVVVDLVLNQYPGSTTEAINILLVEDNPLVAVSAMQIPCCKVSKL